MLGFYENFPKNIHKTTSLSTSISTRRLQQTLTQTLHEINNKTFNVEEITYPSVPQCSAILEFGIAETNNFTYLDTEETNKVMKALRKNSLQIMDFFCSIRYYKMQNEKKTPLRFDYYMIRFTFDKDSMTMQIFHERGPRYVSPEDLANLIVNKINETSSKRILKALEPT